MAARQTLDCQSRSRLHPKKNARDRIIALTGTHPDWALGFQDECWWSRFAQPSVRTWTEPEAPLHLVEQTPPKRTAGTTTAKALASYGLLVRQTHGPDRMLLRFVDGRPVSAVTCDFLAWCCTQLHEKGITTLVMIWDNASWHTSQIVRTWLRTHNRAVAAKTAVVRVIPIFLPAKSPWLNAIEPKWVHGKRAIVEADGILTPDLVEDRACDYYCCPREPHLVMPQKAA